MYRLWVCGLYMVHVPLAVRQYMVHVPFGHVPCIWCGLYMVHVPFLVHVPCSGLYMVGHVPCIVCGLDMVHGVRAAPGKKVLEKALRRLFFVGMRKLHPPISEGLTFLGTWALLI